MERSPLAFTCGDPSGIGPETVVSLLRRGSLHRVCAPLLVGEPLVWRRAGWKPGLAPLADSGLGLRPPRFGADSAAGGRASFAAVRLAARLAARVLRVVTAPVSSWPGRWPASPSGTTLTISPRKRLSTRMIRRAQPEPLDDHGHPAYPLSAVARSLDLRPRLVAGPWTARSASWQPSAAAGPVRSTARQRGLMARGGQYPGSARTRSGPGSASRDRCRRTRPGGCTPRVSSQAWCACTTTRPWPRSRL